VVSGVSPFRWSTTGASITADTRRCWASDFRRADLGCTKIHCVSARRFATNSRPTPLSARYGGGRPSGEAAIARS